MESLPRGMTTSPRGSRLSLAKDGLGEGPRLVWLVSRVIQREWWEAMQAWSLKMVNEREGKSRKDGDGRVGGLPTSIEQAKKGTLSGGVRRDGAASPRGARACPLRPR